MHYCFSKIKIKQKKNKEKLTLDILSPWGWSAEAAEDIAAAFNSQNINLRMLKNQGVWAINKIW